MDLLRSLMPGDSDLAVRMRGMDWTATELGEPQQWPDCLRGAVRICLTSRLPIFLGWGEQFSLVYNDGCIPLLGPGRHPAALGQPARRSLPDLWDQLGPLLDASVKTGIGQPAQLVMLEQGVRLYCSPILAEDGLTVRGVFCLCTHPLDGYEELQASERQFRRYFDFGPAGMALTSPGKSSFEVNAQLCRMLGYSRQELLGVTWAELTHPDDLEADLAQFQRVLAGEIDGYTMDKRWIRKDGQILHTTMATHGLRGPLGEVQFFVSLVHDTTAREAAEAALRRSEANLAHGQRISHVGSWSWDAATREMFCSQETLRIFGLEPGQQASAETFMRLVHPADTEAVRRSFEQALAAAAPYEIEYRTIRPDGTLRHVVNEAQPVLDAAGQVRAYVGTSMDVTERRQAQEQLSASERRFRQLIESIPHHVWSLHAGPDRTLAGARLGYWNQRLLDYTGLSPQELRGGGWAALHPDDLQQARELWDAAIAGGTEYQMEQRVRGRDGNYRRFVCRAVPVQDGEGRQAEWFGTNTDVEDRARSEEALRQLQADLARVARATTLGGLAASIAHEVNQPLAAIATSAAACLRWLAARPPNIAEAMAAASHIVRDASRAGDIILRIRKFLQRGAVSSEDVDLVAVVTEVAAMVQGELRTRKVALRIVAAPGLPAVRADRVQLQQVALNLLVNAIEAMTDTPEGSRNLDVEIRRQGEADVVVAVKDSGTGLAAADGQRIFEAFYTTKPSGTGMGLTISRSIIEAHDGRLWAANNPDGPGATVSFRLPASRPRPAF
ncbi:MAG: sensor histidine kinase [Ramlibacter sp.]|nr:sensor histidine kinase [Ramlibacter sp.]